MAGKFVAEYQYLILSGIVYRPPVQETNRERVPNLEHFFAQPVYESGK